MTVQQAFELALQHHRAGRLAEAEALYRQILAVEPRHADALHLLGVIAHQAGRSDVAVEMILQAIALAPTVPAYHGNLGEAYRKLGRLDEAVAALRRAVQLQPDYAEAYSNLGNALVDRGQFEEAIAAFRRAIQIQPGYAGAHYNLGNALADQGHSGEAVAAYRQAIQLQPGLPQAHYNLGVTLVEQGQLEEAIAAYRQAIQLQPDSAEIHGNLGVALAGRRQFEEAIAAYRRAIQLQPAYAKAHSNLGVALREQGQVDEAIAACRRAIRLQPDFVDAHSNLLFYLHHLPRADPIEVIDEHRRWDDLHARPLAKWIVPHGNEPAPERRLRIGYVSPDFRDHVVGRNLRPLFHHHDHRAFETFVYAGVPRPDNRTQEFQQTADHWRSTVGVGDAPLAEMIRGDGVDILVDLSQHTAGNRLSVFARQPAPVQVSFAGYPESAGVDAIGYRISDRWLEGGGNDECRMSNAEGRSSERVYLLDSFWCYDPCGADAAVNALPAIQSGYLTFGCLNHFGKVNEPVLRLWARVLGTVKDSRLLLRSVEGSHRERTFAFLENLGVAPGRVEFIDSQPRLAYLEVYHRLDLVLDTFPYGGHTTNLDALWMGVPVVSLAGERPVSRAGLSILKNLELPELVAFSEDDYVRIAFELANDLPRLAELRRTLRSRMENSVLMDGPRFARQIEAAYRAMWREWCAGKA